VEAFLVNAGGPIKRAPDVEDVTVKIGALGWLVAEYEKSFANQPKIAGSAMHFPLLTQSKPYWPTGGPGR
jgi:hypothetical protein